MTREVSWRRFGPDALVLEFGDGAEWDAVERARLAVASLPALREATSGFTTLLCEFEPGGMEDPAATAEDLLRALASEAKVLPEPRVHEIPVKYDGPDLKRVAEHAGISVEEVVSRHGAPEYLVRILGFMPGFPYLEGLDPKLATPRLATPRKKISMGAVGIGGHQTGIYPIPSPGGWNLIGHTGARLFDPLREGTEERFLLRAGDRLRFVAV